MQVQPLLIGLFAFAPLLIAPADMARSTNASAGHAAAAVPTRDDDGCGICYWDGSPPFVQHYFPGPVCVSGTDCYEYGAEGNHSWYLTGTCSDHHMVCGMTYLDDLDKLNAAIKANDSERIRQLMLRTPRGYVVNATRQVIQFLDCQGRVRGQVRIPVAEVEALTH